MRDKVIWAGFAVVVISGVVTIITAIVIGMGY